MRYILITCFLCSLLCCKEHEEKPPLLPEVVLTIDTVRDPDSDWIYEITTMSKDSSIMFYSAFMESSDRPDISIIKFHDIAFLYDVNYKNKVSIVAQLKDVKYKRRHMPKYTLDGPLFTLEDDEVCEFKDGKPIRSGKIVWDEKLNPPH